MRAARAAPHATSQPTQPSVNTADAPAGPLDWDLLNRQLREAGFGGLAMVSAAATAAAIANAAAEAASAPGGGVLMAPEPGSLHRCLGSVLEQYVRRNKLVTELLAATEQSGRVAAQQEAALRDLQRELNVAKAAADRARRELAELASQQLPKTEARYSAQMAKLRSEAAKMKESLRDAEVEAAAKGEEIRSLRATITGLQAAAGHTADVEAAGLRQRLAQLEAVVRARDKELDKLRSIKEVTVVQAEDGQANALDRAYEAETTARRLEAELVAARTRVGQLEQANAKRDRDVATMRDDLAAIKTCEAAASRAAAERAAAAEEAARRSEAEAAGLRGKVKELEAQLRAARQELDKRRADSEALRSAAYQEVYRLEDEVRVMGADLAAARNRAAQLEHVVRSKERDVARTKDEKEAAKAAERERARVAEDVSIKLEAELQAVKVRLAQAEGGLRTSEREAARLAELLRQTQGAEVEAWLKQAKSEEGSKKLESDFMSLRLRVLQLEAALKGRDKEVDKLGRGVEAIKAEAHELASKLAKSEEAARKAEGELSAARGKVLTLEGHVRVKEREQERLVRLVEGLKAGEAEVASRQGALEEAARRLEAALMAARGRVSGLEGVVRARDAAVERLNRQLEAAKTSDFERTAQVSKMEEVARQQEAESAAVRQRVVQLEGLLRTKERDLERSNRQAEAARAAEGDMERRLADAGVAAAKLEVEVAAGRTRAAQLGEELRARERELAALTRSLEAQRSAEHSANVAVGKTEEAAKRLDSEASELRQRLVQAEGLLRVREREAERVARVLEAAQAAAADAAFKQSEAEAASRRLEAEAAGLRQRLAQTEGAVRSRERDVDRAEKLVEQAKCAEAEADTRRRAAEASVSAVDGEMSSLRSRIGQLEAAARGHTKEVERLMRVVDQSKTAEIAATARAQRSETAAKQVAAELVSARGRLSKLEASLAARGAESVRLQKLLVAAEAAASAQEARAEEFMRRVESDMAAMRQRALQLAGLLKGRDRQLTTLRGGSEAAQAEQEKVHDRLRQCEDVIRKLEAELVSERQQVAQTAGQLRGRDKQITTLRNGLEALQGDQEKATAQLRKCEEALRKLDSDLSAERQRAAQLDGQVKARDKELERLTRQLDAGRDHSSSAAVVAGKEAAGLKEAAAKAEAALATARARITELESEMVSKERQLDGLQRLAGYSRAGDAEAAALAAERAGRAEEAAKRLDVELAGVRQKYSQLEHMYRSREAVIDKLKASLADKVAREERRLARDKAAYTRIRAAYLQTMAHSSTAGGAGGTPSGKAAGAMAAAARELRPVEIVGLYESRREALEEELSVCRAEVRSLAEQLRDAQNLITMKERSGAWRTPQELTDMQARVIMLERRCADLQREVERGRAEAAEAGRAAERRLAEAERRAAALKEDNEALVHELDGRPTLQENRALKRELEILEKRVLQMKGSAAASGAGAVAEGGETALGLAVASKGRAGGPLMTTAQRMARDKSLHRLGLRGLEDWPKDVLVDLVQDVCIELDLSDATTLPAAVRKTLRVVDAAPRMEGFIAAVCEAVYKRGAAFVPPHIDGTTDPNRVLEVLAVWLGLLQEGSQLRGVMRSVSEALASRAEGMATPIHGPGDVLLSIRQLVEAEAVALTARESLAAASHHMAQQPEALLSRLVHHFMRLFDCPSLEGVVPCVNRLYVSLNELRNFARSLAATLGLPADAGASACMGRVRELLDAAAGRGEGGAGQQQRSSADGGGDRLLPDYIKGNHASAASPAASAGQPPAGAAAAAVGVEVSAALERLMAVFTVRTAGAAADAAERAVGRLRRLDEVLPRYQRLTSQLFEALRCTSLEEVMPAVRSLLAAAQQALY
nr:basal body protein [Chlamydomonas reinhardtii]